MVAMVEIQIVDIPQWILIMFVVNSVSLIAVHLLALTISTCILPDVEAVANLPYQTPRTVQESPHFKMRFLVELAWILTTVMGILLFLTEVTILYWVKFYNLSTTTSWATTGLISPFIVIAFYYCLKMVS